MLTGRSLCPRLFTCRGQRGKACRTHSHPGPWPLASAGAGAAPPSLTWYRSWAPRLPASSEAEKLRYLVESSWLEREEARWVGVPWGPPEQLRGALAAPGELWG